MADSFDKSAILDSFIDEVLSYMPRIIGNLEALQEDPTNPDLREESYRCAHTIKSSAGMMGFPKLSDLARTIEELLAEVQNGQLSVTYELIALVQRSLGRADFLLGGLKGTRVDESKILSENAADHREFRSWLTALPPAEATSAESEVGIDQTLGEILTLEMTEQSADAEAPVALPGLDMDTSEVEEADPFELGSWGFEEPQMPDWLSAVAPEAFQSLPNAELDLSGETDVEEPVADLGEAEAFLPETDEMGLAPQEEEGPEQGIDREGQVRWSDLLPPVLNTPEEVVERLRSSVFGLLDQVDSLDDEVGRFDGDRSKLRQCLAEIEDHLRDLSSFKPKEGAGALITDVRYSRLHALVIRLQDALQGLPSITAGLESRQSGLQSAAIGLRNNIMDLDAVLLAMSQPTFFVSQSTDSDAVPAERQEVANDNAEQLASLRAQIEGEVRDVLLRQLEADRSAGAEKENLESSTSLTNDAENLAQLRAQLEDEVRAELQAKWEEERSRQGTREAVQRAEWESQLRCQLTEEIRAELAEEMIIRRPGLNLALPTFAEDFSRLSGAFLPVETESMAVMADEDLLSRELAAEMAETFLIEAEDHLQNINRVLPLLETNPEDQEVIRSLRRSVHTLKGAAAMVGFNLVSGLAHTLEDLLDEVNDGRLLIDPEVQGLILDACSGLEGLIEAIGSGKSGDASVMDDLQPRFDTLLAGLSVAEDSKPQEQAFVTGSPSGSLVEGGLPYQEEQAIENAPIGRNLVEGDDPEPDATLETLQASRPTVEPAVIRSAALSVRVDMDHLDEFVNLVGELVIIRTTFEQRVESLMADLEELGLSTQRLRRLARDLEIRYEVPTLQQSTELAIAAQTNDKYGRRRRLGSAVEGFAGEGRANGSTSIHSSFDELEFDRYTEFHQLTREVTEATADVSSISTEMQGLINELETIFVRQGRLSTELQDKLMRVRRVPLANLVPRLHRAMRSVALKQRKKVDLLLEGETVEVDRTVFEEVADPLLHLIRNAVDHGIETPDARRAAGKPEVGQVRLMVKQEGNHVVITISDDGAGINSADVRAAAVASGAIQESEIISEEGVLDLIFAPGLSTSTEITEISGRGVGLDVVRTNVSRLKGSVSVASVPGQGTTFTVRLPLTLVITKALLVSAGGQTYALPLPLIKYIGRISREAITRVGSDSAITVGEEVYAVRSLARLLEEKVESDDEPERPIVLIVGVGERMIALTVDAVLAEQEIVVKSLGSHLRVVKGVSGATILGNGQVVLIINLLDLIGEEKKLLPAPARPIRTSGAIVTPHVLVVDDSLSVRRVLTSLLQKSGWVTKSARDGVEALDMVTLERPAVMIVDIEMPRMDGYELITVLRGQSAYQDVPIAVLTSRAGQKHREKAMELGADAYIVKPFQEDDLLRIVGDLAKRRHQATAS